MKGGRVDVAGDRGSFGALLRRFRLEAGISQEELALRAHLSFESISALERGRRRAPYHHTIRMLAEGLGLAEPQRGELERAAQRPRLPAAHIAADAAEDPSRAPAAGPEIPQNLPLQRTSLVGRAADVAAIVSTIRANRLVTVTGAGGVGKTRTAVAVGDAELDRTSGGVWLVEFAPVVKGSLVAAAVARALNVQEQAGRPLLETLIAHLKAKPLLLLFDNCEHVIADAAALADALLTGCPQLRILATSREPLRIGGERLYRLPSLQFAESWRAATLRALEAQEFPALVLFAQRALQRNPRFVLDDDSAPIVAEICRRLDGIPLAIELAAARVNVLSLRDLLSKLDERFRILTSGDRTALPRQQTMRALIDWSYDLLSPPERRLFERLSIFAGGCTLASMTAVYADDGDEIEVLELLSALIDKSLVAADLDVPEPRYRLLESFRQYASEKLAARGESDRVADRHAAAYVELAERMEREHDVARSSVWFARAELEIENWRAALHWTLVDGGDRVVGQRLAGAMRAVWPTSAIAEGRRWLQLAFASVDERTPPLVAAHLEHSVATVAYMFGEFAAALASSRRLIDVFAELGDDLGVARAQFLTGRSLANLGQVEAGEPLLQRSLDAARVLGNTPLAGLALAGLARARALSGDLCAARAHLAEAFEIYEATGADAYSVLAQSAAAGIEFRAGNTEGAVQLSRAALTAMRTFGLPLFATLELNALAAYLVACDRWPDARARAREALVTAQETQQPVEILWALQYVAAVAALSADAQKRAGSTLQRAALVLGFVDARIAASGAVRGHLHQHGYDRAHRVLRDALGPEKLQNLMALGAALTEDRAIDAARAL